jgi:Sec-independent protein translocase protein TatA
MPVDLIIVLLIILGLVLVWRGPKTLPQWGAALGKAFRVGREEATKAQGAIQHRLDDPDQPDDAGGPPSTG